MAQGWSYSSPQPWPTLFLKRNDVYEEMIQHFSSGDKTMVEKNVEHIKISQPGPAVADRLLTCKELCSKSTSTWVR